MLPGRVVDVDIVDHDAQVGDLFRHAVGDCLHVGSIGVGAGCYQVHKVVALRAAECCNYRGGCIRNTKLTLLGVVALRNVARGREDVPLVSGGAARR